MADLPEHVPPLTPSELAVLSVFWEGKEEGISAMKLSEAHERLSARRKKAGDVPPAITTVSSALRTLNAKGALREVRVKDGDAEGGEGTTVVRTRGIFSGTTRSPHTGYEATLDMAEALGPTFRGLAELYPTARRHEALVDFARGMGLPERMVRQIAELAKKAI